MPYPRAGAAPRRARARQHAAAVAHARRVEKHAARPAEHVELLHQGAHAAHARALLFGRHGEREVHRRGALLDVVGFTISDSDSSRAAPVNCDRINTPCSSSRAATNSLATRFMPSCRLET